MMADDFTRPPVTFVLLSYNQQRFIREAIEGAFAQTYEPLEIILSDDCSTDGTFQIIQEMASAYDGPHLVKTNQNRTNLGLIPHFNRIIQHVSTEYIVCAAGDDSSFPSRTSRIVDEFIEKSAYLVHSNYVPIDKNGLEIHNSEGMPDPIFNKSDDLNEIALSMALYVGATGAFSKQLFRKYGEIECEDAYEDLIMGYRAALEGRVGFVQSPLVRYRMNVGISQGSNSAKTGNDEKQQYIAYVKLRRAVYLQRLIDTKRCGRKHSHLIRNLKREYNYWNSVLRYIDNKISFLFNFPKYPRSSFKILCSALESKRKS